MFSTKSRGGLGWSSVSHSAQRVSQCKKKLLRRALEGAAYCVQPWPSVLCAMRLRGSVACRLLIFCVCSIELPATLHCAK